MFDIWGAVELLEEHFPPEWRKRIRGVAGAILLASGLGLSKAIGSLGHWTAERYQALPPWIFPIFQRLVLILAGVLIGYFLGRSKRIDPEMEAPTSKGPSADLDDAVQKLIEASPSLRVNRWEKVLSYEKVHWRMIVDGRTVDARGEVQGPLCGICGTELSIAGPHEAFSMGRLRVSATEKGAFYCPRPGCGFRVEGRDVDKSREAVRRIGLADYRNDKNGFKPEA